MTSTLIALLVVQSLSSLTYAQKITPAKDDAAGQSTSTAQTSTSPVISALEKLVSDNTKTLDNL